MLNMTKNLSNKRINAETVNCFFFNEKVEHYAIAISWSLAVKYS